MKKIYLISLVLSLMLIAFTGCSAPVSDEADGNDEGKLQIVSTIFPGYDFAKNITGENAKLSILLPPGSESHSFEPSPQDIIKIQNADLFIYVGGESDEWVNTILESMDKKVNTLKMMDAVALFEEEAVEGAKSGDGHEDEYDEHVWTSPENAIKISQEIAKNLSGIDPSNGSIYEENLKIYMEKLSKLDNDFRKFFSTVENKTIIFGDRFPLLYFAKEYDLEHYSAFPGCSDGSEPSAATIAFLMDKIKSENIGTVFYIEFSNHKIADILAESAGTKTAMFHSCHNVSKEEIENGSTYISLMEQNLETLKGAMK
ncbi:MAG: metal ABC transporter substrate-binding protein [Proteocatella sp.]